MFFKRLLLTLALLAGLSAPALASQGSGCMPTTGQISGLTFAIANNAALDALTSNFSGASAPVTACSGASLTGQMWVDTSTSPYVLKVYDGTSWLPIGTIDPASHLWTPPLGGGTGSIVSAATTDLCASLPQSYVTITAANAISSFGSTCVAGAGKIARFTSAGLVLTYNVTSMILPGGINITTQAGDVAYLVPLGGGNWLDAIHMRADGTALTTASAFASQISFTGVISPAALAVTTNDWAPAGLATASVIRASGSVDVSITGLTAQPTGTVLILDNIGSTILTLSDASASSSAANRFSFGADALLGPGQSVMLRYDGTLSRWTGAADFKNTASATQAATGTDNATTMTPLRTAQEITALAAGVYPPGLLWGLTLSNNVSDATNDIDLSAGSARDGGDTANMLLASSITKRLDATWAVGTNQGGLDTGSIANTLYYVWLIKRSDTAVVDVLFSTSATSPTMPTNYTLKRRVGEIYRSSATIRPFKQSGDRFYLTTQITQTLSGPSTRTLVTLNVPPNTIAMIRARAAGGSGDPQYSYVQPSSAADFVPSSSGSTLASLAPDTIGSFEILTDSSSQIAARAATGFGNIIVNVLGWIDDRGRSQ